MGGDDPHGLKRKTQELPNAIAAEQAILGVILYDNAAFAALPPDLSANHFFEPLHRRLYQRIKMALDAGRLADVVLADSWLATDPAYRELGGVDYLMTLVDQAPPSANAADYAREILQKHIRRSLAKLGTEMSTRADDATWSNDEMLSELEETIGELHMAGGTLRLVDPAEAMATVMDHATRPPEEKLGILTGLDTLDEKLGPWLAGDVIALAGRPGMGKSAVAAIIGRNVAVAGGGVIEIHGEMSVEQVWRRRMTATAFEIFANEAPAYSALRKRKVTYDQVQMLERAQRDLADIPLLAIKRTGMTLGRMRALAMHQKAKFERLGIKLSLLAIDHGGLIKPDREYNSRVDQQTAVSGGLKELADFLQIPILVLLQLNRQVESRDDKRPTLPDLRDSGSWEQDADVVIGAYREAYYAQHSQEPDMGSAKGQLAWSAWDKARKSKTIEALLLKVREGETGTAKLWAHMATNTILGLEPDDSLGGLI